jgi:ABC-type transport system substrate-binding protein
MTDEGNSTPDEDPSAADSGSHRKKPWRRKKSGEPAPEALVVFDDDPGIATEDEFALLGDSDAPSGSLRTGAPAPTGPSTPGTTDLGALNAALFDDDVETSSPRGDNWFGPDDEWWVRRAQAEMPAEAAPTLPIEDISRDAVQEPTWTVLKPMGGADSGWGDMPRGGDPDGEQSMWPVAGGPASAGPAAPAATGQLTSDPAAPQKDSRGGVVGFIADDPLRAALIIIPSVCLLIIAVSMLILMGRDSKKDDAAQDDGIAPVDVTTTLSENEKVLRTRRPDLTIAVVKTELMRPDPIEAVSPAELLLVDQLFDGLTQSDVSGAAQPGLAVSWVSNDDATRFEFVLRDTAVFHDGSPITADDVIATFQRIAAPNSPLRQAAGVRLIESDDAGRLTGVSESESGDVVFELTEPFPDFPLVLSSPSFGIVPANASLPMLFNTVVGSGPYRVRGVGVSEIQLEAVTSLSSQTAGVDLGRDNAGDASTNLFWIVGLESDVQTYEALRLGTADIATVPNGDVRDATARFGGEGFKPYPAELYYGINSKAEGLDNPVFREAIVKAVDRGSIVREVYEGALETATGIVPQGVPGSSADACGDRCKFDRQAAKALVAEAFPEGDVPRMTVSYDADDGRQKQVAEAIAADLDAAGIPARASGLPAASLGRAIEAGDVDIFQLSWVGEYPSANAFLAPMFESGSIDNVVGLEDEKVDDLLSLARQATSSQERNRQLQAAESAILDQNVIIPLGQFVSRWAAGDQVTNFAMSGFGSINIDALSFNAEAAQTAARTGRKAAAATATTTTKAEG